MDVADKKNRAVGVIFLSTIFVMFALIILCTVIRAVEKYLESQTPTWNAAEFYPFPDEQVQETLEVLPPWKQLSERIIKLEKRIENRATEDFYFRRFFVLVKKVSDKAVGLDMTMSQTGGENELIAEDVVVPWREDSLGYVMKDFDISEQIDSLIAFGEKMEAEERNFLVFLVPEKCAGNEGYHDYSAKKEQEILEALTEADLDFIHVSDEIQKRGLDMASMFFKTDHHWLPSSGIWADGLLCDTLNEKYGYELDSSVFDMGNYVTTIMPNEYFGSQGNKVMEVYVDIEDFPVTVPTYDTYLEVFNSKTNKISNGSIEETLFDFSAFEEPDVYKRNDYRFYGQGDQALFQIHNRDRNDGNHVLLIKASFANVMYPFLTAAMENLDVLDPRYFNGSIEAYINDREPDTVVIVYGVTSFNDNGIANPLFDFR